MATDQQLGWYIGLIVEAWNGHGVISADSDLLWRRAKAGSRETFEQNSQLVLSEFHEFESQGRRFLLHPRIRSLYEQQSMKYAQTVEAGKKSAEARRLKLQQQQPHPRRTDVLSLNLTTSFSGR